MNKDELTPCGALFDIMKRYGGISNKELASLILSGKPLSDGVSPASRVNDRTWLSRFVVHAPVGSIQERYFAGFSSSALRVVARLKSGGRRHFTSAEIMDLITGEKGAEMKEALALCHQDISLYDNVLSRLERDNGHTETERMEMAMVLFITAGCTANVRRAAEEVISFSDMMHGAGMATPLVTPKAVQQASGMRDRIAQQPTSLVLFRIEDGYLKGEPHWLDHDAGEIEIGSLALGDAAITDVDPDVSGTHLKITYDQGTWYAQGAGSSFGTVLIHGTDHAETVIEPPREKRADGEEYPKVPIRPGDELLLGANTRFLIMEGKA